VNQTMQLDKQETPTGTAPLALSPAPETLLLARPNSRVRLGAAKMRRIKRSQDLVEFLGYSTALFITVMFLLDGAVSQIVDVATALSAISRLTALVATDLLLIHILLVARVPWIERLYGHDRTTTAHKKLGKPILYLVLAHFAASLVQYAILDGQNLWDTFLFLFFDVADMWTATIALALMIVVVITSINMARKKLSYEAWYIVHLLSYGAVMLAIPHQFSTGSDIAGKPIQQAFWIALYFFVALNLVWYRVLSPVVKSLRHNLRVDKVVRESSDTVSVYIGGKRLETIGGKGGQFYLLRIMTASQWFRPHPFSISAAPNSRYVRFSIGNRGDDTSLMPYLRKGTRVILEGPYGVFTEDRRSKPKVTLIAAGIGVPPIRALAESMAAKAGDIQVIYRTRSEDDAALLEELKTVCEVRGFGLHVLTGSRGEGASWMPAGDARPDHQRLLELVHDVAGSDVFICGPAAWTRAVEKTLHRVGTPANHIHAEEFAW